MDVVYAISDSGNGSIWDNNELRYSLRSLDKYVSGIEKVIIVGYCPEFIRSIVHPPSNFRYTQKEYFENIIHIPHKDITEKSTGDSAVKYKEQNIFNKIYTACVCELISDDFIFMNDDMFFTKPKNYLTENRIYYYHGTIEQSMKQYNKRNSYFNSLKNTMDMLREKFQITTSLFPEDYDGHFPIIYNKRRFINTVGTLDWTKDYGYVIKSSYVNLSHDIVNAQLVKDCKIRGAINDKKLRILMSKNVSDKDSFIFSIGEGALNPAMKNYLQELYPEKSRFEI